MGFLPKTWKRRIVEFPGRRRLGDTSATDIYDVSRAEGNVIQEGDGFTAQNMNDLEQRIADGFADTEKIFSMPFDSTKTYAVGNYCIKDDTLYKFITAKPAGEWDVTKVKAVSVETEFKEYEQKIKDSESAISKLTEKISTINKKELVIKKIEWHGSHEVAAGNANSNLFEFTVPDGITSSDYNIPIVILCDVMDSSWVPLDTISSLSYVKDFSGSSIKVSPRFTKPCTVCVLTCLFIFTKK